MYVYYIYIQTSMNYNKVQISSRFIKWGFPEIGDFPSSHPVGMRIFYKIPMGKLTLKIVIFQFVMSSFLKSGDFPKSPFPQGKITIFDR